MAIKMARWLRWFWKWHPRLYRWSGGRIGKTLMNMPVLLLTTTGRKSGQPRTRALMYLPNDNRYMVVASYLGQPKHPAWWLNLSANPDAEVQVGSRRIPVRARELDGKERDRWWDEIVAQQSEYAEYQTRTNRKFPVVALEPRA